MNGFLVDPSDFQRGVLWFSAYLLDVIVAQSTTIFELLSGKDQSLLVWWDTLLVLDLCFNIVDRIAGLDLKGDGLARKGLDEAINRKQNMSVLKSRLPHQTGPSLHWGRGQIGVGIEKGWVTYICTAGEKKRKMVSQILHE